MFRTDRGSYGQTVRGNSFTLLGIDAPVSILRMFVYKTCEYIKSFKQSGRNLRKLEFGFRPIVRTAGGLYGQTDRGNSATLLGIDAPVCMLYMYIYKTYKYIKSLNQSGRNLRNPQLTIPLS